MGQRFIINIVRHGETMANRLKIMQGQMDVELSELGRKQAQLIATRLKNENFTHMFSSDLSRAADTARAIAEANTTYQGGLVLDMKLRERGFGSLEGKPLSELKKAAEEAKVSMHDYLPEGGETMDQLAERAKEFFNELCVMLSKYLIQGENIIYQKENGIDPCHFSPESREDVSVFSKIFHSSHSKEASPHEPLHTDSTEPHSNPNDNRNPGSSSTIQTDHSSNLSQGNPAWKPDLESFCPSPPAAAAAANVLIVSHGLLIRELKKLILDRHIPRLQEEEARKALHICPNTGLSRFTMSVSVKNNHACVTCEEINFISNASHLVTSSENFVSVAQFQGSL